MYLYFFVNQNKILETNSFKNSIHQELIRDSSLLDTICKYGKNIAQARDRRIQPSPLYLPSYLKYNQRCKRFKATTQQKTRSEEKT